MAAHVDQVLESAEPSLVGHHAQRLGHLLGLVLIFLGLVLFVVGELPRDRGRTRE